MNQIDSPIYLNEKQASARYGYSRAWFQRNRWLGTGPQFIKVNDNGRVLYPINETDDWFASFGLRQNTAMSEGGEKK